MINFLYFSELSGSTRSNHSKFSLPYILSFPESVLFQNLRSSWDDNDDNDNVDNDDNDGDDNDDEEEEEKEFGKWMTIITGQWSVL